MLTEKENEVLRAIAENCFMDGLTGSDAVGKEIWSDCIDQNERIVSSVQLPGVVSSLKKKGLIKCTGGHPRDATVWLTEAGAHHYWPESFGGAFPIAA